MNCLHYFLFVSLLILPLSIDAFGIPYYDTEPVSGLPAGVVWGISPTTNMLGDTIKIEITSQGQLTDAYFSIHDVNDDGKTSKLRLGIVRLSSDDGLNWAADYYLSPNNPKIPDGDYRVRIFVSYDATSTYSGFVDLIVTPASPVNTDIDVSVIEPLRTLNLNDDQVIVSSDDFFILEADYSNLDIGTELVLTYDIDDQNNPIEVYSEIITTTSGTLDEFISVDWEENASYYFKFTAYDTFGTSVTYDDTRIIIKSLTDTDATAAGIDVSDPATQPNALVSYDRDNNEFVVSWDFNTNADTQCGIKANFGFMLDDMSDFAGGSGMNGFIPLYYSTVSSNPVVLTDIISGLPTYVAEEISCSGSFKILVDVILADELNQYNTENLMVFITFYELIDGEFSSYDNTRIDEVLITYAPNYIYTSSDQQYFCQNQIGNIIMLEQFALTGLDGNYCDKGYSINFKQYFVINSDGVTTDYHNGNYSPLIKVAVSSTVVEEEEVKKKKSNGGCSDCTPPTIGVDSKGKRFVDQGIILNNTPIEVNYFYTEMPMQYTTVGALNRVDLKIYENNGPAAIEYVQLALGVKEIGTPINEAQAIIEIDVDPFFDDIENPRIQDLTITDPDHILGSVTALLSLTDCGSVDAECLLVQITWKYRVAPDYDVLAVNTWDWKRNSMTDYFNDGLHVVVDEIIEPEPEPYKYVCNDTPLDEIMGPVTRNNCHFRALTLLWK